MKHSARFRVLLNKNPFLESPETFRASKAVCYYLYLKNKAVCMHETLHEGNFVHIKKM